MWRLPLILAAVAAVLAGSFVLLAPIFNATLLGDTDEVAARRAEALAGPLCKLGDVLMRFSVENDTAHYEANYEPIHAEGTKAIQASYNYVKEVSDRIGTSRDPKSYATRRTLERLWNATKRTEMAIRGAIGMGELSQRMGGPSLMGVPHEAITAEVLIAELGGDTHGESCAHQHPADASDSLLFELKSSRNEAVDSLMNESQEAHERAIQKAEMVARDPDSTPEERRAAADDAIARAGDAHADYKTLAKQASIRLFGMAPE